MKINKLTVKDSLFPQRLSRVQPACRELFVSNSELLSELLQQPCVAIVGSRKVSAYGREVTADFARQLAGRGITIISGLAFGVDSIAHQAALEAGGHTIAVLPGSLERVYPTSHRHLAERIASENGVLVSEYPAGSDVRKHNFIARNRLISGLSNAVLITEAAVKSGSLHTAEFALEQGIEVLAVPGNITNPTAAGTNNLIKIGATPATSIDDVLHVLGLAETSRKAARRGRGPEEQQLIDLLEQGVRNGDAPLTQSQLSVELFNQTLTMLELSGTIRPLGANHWSLR